MEELKDAPQQQMNGKLRSLSLLTLAEITSSRAHSWKVHT